MSKKAQLILLGFLIIIAAFNILDVYADIQMHASMFHIIEEAIITVVTVILIVYVLLVLSKQSYNMEQLRQELKNSKENIQKQSEKMNQARIHYTQVIIEQYKEWQFTKSEQEIANLMLKGLSLQEIAQLRGVKESSVRQQASSMYAKSGLQGRHALAAWFFEDIIN